MTSPRQETIRYRDPHFYFRLPPDHMSTIPLIKFGVRPPYSDDIVMSSALKLCIDGVVKLSVYEN